MAHRTRRRLSAGAAATLGLGLAGLGLAAPANAATTLTYTCEVPIIGAQDFQVSMDTDAPDSGSVGETVEANVTGSVTLNDTTVNAMTGLLGWRKASGTTTTSDDLVLTTPLTVVSDGSTVNAELPFTGGPVPVALEAEGEQTIDAPDSFTSVFQGYDADGAEKEEFEIPCTYASGNQVIDTVTVEAADPPDEPGTDDDHDNDGTDEPGTDDDHDNDGTDNGHDDGTDMTTTCADFDGPGPASHPGYHKGLDSDDDGHYDYD